MTTDQDHLAPVERSQVWSDILVGLRVLVLLVASGVCLQTGAMLVSRLHPLLGLACHFSFHGLVIGCLCLPWLWLLRARKATLLLGICVLISLFTVRPWELLPINQSSVPAGFQNQISVLSWNVLESNPFPKNIESVVERADADVVVLIEYHPNLAERLSWFHNHYPYRLELPDVNGAGIAVFSRVAGTQFNQNDFGHAPQPGIVVTLGATKEQSDLQLVALHTLSPLPARRAQIRNEQLRSLTFWSQQQTDPICVCGDLNITPWDYAFQSVLDGGFHDTRIGNGNCATWPAKLGFLALPIDHVLTNSGCFVSQRQVLPTVTGSDHRPVRFIVHY